MTTHTPSNFLGESPYSNVMKELNDIENSLSKDDKDAISKEYLDKYLKSKSIFFNLSIGWISFDYKTWDFTKSIKNRGTNPFTTRWNVEYKNIKIIDFAFYVKKNNGIIRPNNLKQIMNVHSDFKNIIIDVNEKIKIPKSLGQIVWINFI